MTDTLIKWKDIEKRLIPIFEIEIQLMDDITASVIKNYHPKKIYPFREICLGYLLIAHSNAKATLFLINENLVHQVHYISRNTFEMVTTLYYIDDDESKKDALVERYFKFNASIVPFKAMKAMHEYPETFREITTNERDKEILREHDAYIKMYGKNTQTWSGKNLPDMIKSLKDDETKNDLLKRYKLMVNMNNNFLHPTRQYIIQSIKDAIKREVDYKIRVMQLHSVSTSADLIIHKFLDNFPKGRPAFKQRLKKINEEYEVIRKTIRSD